MIYILISIICSSLIAIVFKISEGRTSNRFAITGMNYLAGMMVSLIFLRGKPLFNLQWFKAFSGEFTSVLSNGTVFSQEGTGALAVILGIITGVLYFSSFILYQKSVGDNGISLSATFMKLGVVIPVVLSIIFLGERIDGLAFLGIIFSLIAIIVINKSDDAEKKTIKINLIVLLILAGGGDFLTKLFQNYGVTEFKNLYLFYTFLTGLIISTIMLLVKNPRFKVWDLFYGVMVGIPNVLMPDFLIKGLETVKGAVAFPMVSAGTIVISSIIGMVFFKERLGKKEKAGIVMMVIAIILLS